MSRIIAVLVGAFLFPPLAVFAEETQALQEIRELKLLIEQQMKRIDELTVEVGRLHQSVETRKAALAPGPAPKRAVGTAPPFPVYAETPKPEPPRAEVPRAERVKPEPVIVEEAPKPPPPSGVKHLVEKGETLTAIAKRFNVALPDLLKANKNVNDRKLQIGQTLIIPTTAAPDAPKNPETSASEKKENP